MNIKNILAATALGVGTLGITSPAKAELPELVKYVGNRIKNSKMPDNPAEFFNTVHNGMPNWPHKSAGYILLFTGAAGIGTLAYGATRALENKNKQ